MTFYHDIFKSGFSASGHGDGISFVCKAFIGRSNKEHGFGIAQDLSFAAAPLKCRGRIGRGKTGHKNHIIPGGARKRLAANAQALQLGGCWAAV